MKSDGAGRIRVMRVIARMNVGGPAVQVSGLIRGFDSNKFDQRLYAGYCAVDEADYLDSVATDIQAIRIQGFGRRVSFWGDFKAFIKLVKEIRSFKPQIIHTHTAKAGFLGRLASIVSFQRSIRVHTFHGHLLDGYYGPIQRALVIIAEKSLALYTHQLLAVGDKVRQDLLAVRIGKLNKFGIMPPGLELKKLPEQKESLKHYGLPNSTLHCAFIGRVTNIKRPDRFLDVVRESKNRGVSLKFVIAGGGNLLDLCKEKISHEDLPVKILGWQSDIEKVLSAVDIVVLTSDNEGTPLSLIQAGMAGLPVVTTRVGSVDEIVLDGITGFITGLGAQEIVNALELLVDDSKLRAQLGANAREFTLANFGVERLVRDHEALYKKLLASRTRS